MFAAVILADVNVSNDCLFVKLKDVVNYTVKFSLQKMDELHICLDMVLRNKTPNKTNTIIPPLAGSLFLVCVSVFLSICPSKG